MRSSKPTEWKIKKIKEIGKVTTGKRPLKVSEKKSQECSIPIYGGAGIMGYTIQALFKEPILVTGRVGTLGIVHKVKLPSWPSDNTLVVIPYDHDDIDFIFYALKLKMAHLIALNRGTSNPLVTQKDIEELEIPEPLPNEKMKIAQILRSLDDKIELDYEMNKTLEAIAQAIFKNWFVDFEPFKDELVYNEELNRKIPKGWEVVKIGDVVDIKKGLSYKSDDLTEQSKIGLVNLGCIARGGGFRNEVKPYSGEFKPEHVLQVGDIVVAITDLTRNQEIIGMPTRIYPVEDFEVLIASLDLVILTIKDKMRLKQSFLYYLLLTPHYKGYVNGCAEGTTVLHLNPIDILNYKFPLPEEWQIKFAKIADSFFELIIQNYEEINILEKIRDALLPKLLSGEIRVKVDVESEFPEEIRRLGEIKEKKLKVQESLERWLE